MAPSLSSVLTPFNICVKQKSDAGADDVEVPVEGEAFMDDFFAQVFTYFVLILKEKKKQLSAYLPVCACVYLSD